MVTRDEKVKVILENVREVPDFPKPGILFKDIFGVLGNPESAKALYNVIAGDCEPFAGKINAVCGLDARGFLFGPQISQQLNVPFIPIRKKGKLPGPVVSEKFELEYGADEFQVQTQFFRGGSILLVDDLLATGGSLKAAGKLVESLGCKVEGCFVIMELVSLNGRSNLPYPVHSILRF